MKRTLRSLVLFCTLVGASAAGFAAGAVNINTADADALAAALQGIGPVKAQAIVSYRDAHGAFSSVDELQKVDGVGPMTVKHNRKKLTVGSNQ